MTTEKAERPGDDRGAQQGTTEGNATSPQGWQANFVRLAQRAAADPAFYAIAGSGVQRLADGIIARTAGAVNA